MTTDAFTTAAAAEAMRAYRDTGMPRYVLAVHMAEWARDHLAAQEPTDAEVEAAARKLAHWDGAYGWGTPGWSGEIPETSYLHGARAALSAAKDARHG